MRQIDGRLIVSPTDLVSFLACGHRTRLDWEAQQGMREPAFDRDPVLELVMRKGGEHERRHLDHLRSKGLSIVDLSNLGNKSVAESLAAEAATVEAMRGGADVIYQGAFFDGHWRGRPDFLLKVETPGAPFGWSYEVADTKLARDVKAGAIVQLVLYSIRLEEMQGKAPRNMRVITGANEERVFRVDDYSAYLRRVRGRFVAQIDDPESLASTYPDPVEHCRVCSWARVCIERRRDDDHTSLVAGMTRTATRKLVDGGIATTAKLGAAAPGTEVKDLARATFDRLQAQAALQLKQRADGVVRYEFVEEEPAPPPPPPPKVGEKPKEAPRPLGLAALPPPTPEDLFFDIEADPWAGEKSEGIEYLFGLLSAPRGTPVYEPHWAHSAEEEKAMVERFIDRCLKLRREHPSFHVYHYGAYEDAAVDRLVRRYATRDLELEQLQRGQVFVDLYSIVRQGLRISQESYSLKKVEALYMPRREGPITKGGFSVVEYERWLDDREQRHLDDLAAYNRDDCLSTWKLRDWLEERRSERQVELGREIPRPEPKSLDAPEEKQEEIEATQKRIDRLREGLPLDPVDRDLAGNARWRLSLLLNYHRREERPEWWRWFDLRKKSPAELVAEPDAIGDLKYQGEAGTVKRSTLHRYLFDPEQPQKFDVGDKPMDPLTGEGSGEVHFIDAAAGVVDLKRGFGSPVPHPQALIPEGPVRTGPLRAALGRLADDVIERGADVAVGSWQSARELLLRRSPRISGESADDPIRKPNETSEAAAVRAILGLQHSYLAIQGPPGTGKTWTAARMVLALHAARRRVALTGPSHKVIENLIKAVLTESEKLGVKVKIVQKADEDGGFDDPRVEAVKNAAEVVKRLEAGVLISAATAWPYASPELAGMHDVLFVDEAGQFSLANACAASGTARSLVLIGDPNQLPQVTKGVHPEGAGLSALEYVLDGATTLDPHMGLFLDETHRLNPALCSFISDTFYDGRLTPHPKTHGVRVNGGGAIDGTGLRIHNVAHVNRSSRSREEAEVIADLVKDLLTRSWVDREGKTRPLGIDDILIVAPFNAQVATIHEGLKRALNVEARVGTVDKFQGQEGAVVLYSLTCSSAEDAPRDLEFLYSPNRLNVAISRAQALAIVVYNPDLLLVQCRTPEQMRTVNALCRLVETAQQM